MEKALILEYFRAVDEHDISALLAVFHADITYERPGYPPFVGLERLYQFYTAERVIALGQHFLEEIVVEGQAGACWGRFIGAKHDGSPVDIKFVDTYTFEDGKIKTRKTFFFQPAV